MKVEHKCTRCGACCKRWGADGLSVTLGDVLLWEEHKAIYLLDLIGWLGYPTYKDLGEIVGDLWFFPSNVYGAEPRYQCPFLRQTPYTTRFYCEIYELRPEVCRNYDGIKNIGECGLI